MFEDDDFEDYTQKDAIQELNETLLRVELHLQTINKRVGELGFGVAILMLIAIAYTIRDLDELRAALGF